MTSISSWHGPGSDLRKKWYMVNKRSCVMKDRGRQKDRQRQKISGEVQKWSKRPRGEWGRELDTQPNNVLLMRLHGWVPAVFDVHTHTQQRVNVHRVFCFCFLQFSTFANHFPFFTLEHFLVYGSYKGEAWLKGRALFFPLSLVVDQKPFRSKLVLSLIPHLQILLWIQEVHMFTSTKY